MKHRRDDRSTATKMLQAVARGLVVAALGFGLCSLLGDVGIPARVMGFLGLMGATGTAIAIGSYVSAQYDRRCEADARSIEIEDRRADELVAEMAAAPAVPELSVERESNFVRLVDEQRRLTASGDRSRLH